MDTSSFSNAQQTYPDAEQLAVNSSTSDCFSVRLYGKRHFLKRLKPELSSDPRYVSAMQKEFETGYGLEHPNLVRYIAKGDDYLLTEFVDGETLKDFSLSHPDYFKSRGNTERLLAQLLDVVGYLHTHQVVHLDLKPDNILITRIGHDVKLTDLGYCYTDTYTDTMGRTDKYAAPEQLEGGAVDARTDIYALGKILETLPISYKYKKVIAKCTKADKQQRYQSIEEIKHQLNKPNRRNYFLAASVVIAIVVVVILWWPDSQYRTTQTKGDNVPVASSPVDSVTTKEPVHIATEKSENLVDKRHRDLRLLKSEIPHLVDPVYQKTIATFDFEKTGPDLNVWMPLHTAYVEGVNELTPKLKNKYPLVDEIEINRLLWEYAQPPLQKILDEMDER